jgi:hypothetical protein
VVFVVPPGVFRPRVTTRSFIGHLKTKTKRMACPFQFDTRAIQVEKNVRYSNKYRFIFLQHRKESLWRCRKITQFHFSKGCSSPRFGQVH